MQTARRHLRHAVRLALVAMLALALLPTLSRALATAGADGPTGYVEVCTPRGMQLLAVSGGDGAPAAVLHLDHCPYCTAALDHAAAPPPAPAAALPGGVGWRTHPPLFLRAPRTLHAWASANPRAPPATS